MHEEELQTIITELKSRIASLESRRINQQQILPNAILQRHIASSAMLIFKGLASARPTNGSTEQLAYWATDTHTLSIWDGSAWRTQIFT